MEKVIYCNNPFLLMAFFNLLQLGGFNNEENWNDIYNPFRDNAECLYLFVSKRSLSFYSHKCVVDNEKERHTLTENNFDVLLIQTIRQ